MSRELTPYERAKLIVETVQSQIEADRYANFSRQLRERGASASIVGEVQSLSAGCSYLARRDLLRLVHGTRADD